MFLSKLLDMSCFIDSSSPKICLENEFSGELIYIDTTDIDLVPLRYSVKEIKTGKYLVQPYNRHEWSMRQLLINSGLNTSNFNYVKLTNNKEFMRNESDMSSNFFELFVYSAEVNYPMCFVLMLCRYAKKFVIDMLSDIRNSCTEEMIQTICSSTYITHEYIKKLIDVDVQIEWFEILSNPVFHLSDIDKIVQQYDILTLGFNHVSWQFCDQLDVQNPNYDPENDWNLVPNGDKIRYAILRNPNLEFKEACTIVDNFEKPICWQEFMIISNPKTKTNITNLYIKYNDIVGAFTSSNPNANQVAIQLFSIRVFENNIFDKDLITSLFKSISQEELVKVNYDPFRCVHNELPISISPFSSICDIHNICAIRAFIYIYIYIYIYT